ncbi:MAG TPA: AraC family transcriptional regulator [Hyphomicrobiales bacterium]|nr:AraC family transcriptional regulator [Hyphomicrobiales bacterium]
MSAAKLPYDVFRHLDNAGVTLRDAAHLGEGLAAARWLRNETTEVSYVLPNHHTLSLYVSGGEQFRRCQQDGILKSFGAGSLNLMPEAVTSDWLIAGAIDFFHLYIPRPVFDRVVVAALDRDPAHVNLLERIYFADPVLEQLIRLTFLTRNWNDPADSLALSYAGHMLLAHLIGHFSTVGEGGLVAKGGLLPRLLRRIEAYVEAYLDTPLRISDLAGIAGLSEFHFARMFKTSTGESPHRFVQRRRVEKAKQLMSETDSELSEIALACGFATQSHFSACFRKRTGLTPSAYRSAIAL